jgi:hypothetical protein
LVDRLTAPLLLTACNRADCYTFLSSEGGGAGIVIEKASGHYGELTNTWVRVREGDLYRSLVTVKAETYLYETQFRWVIPLDDNKSSWGDQRVKCNYDDGSGDGELIRCQFANGKASAFRWTKAQGVTSFSGPCIMSDGNCEFTLMGREGPFSKNAPSLYLK